jgi:acyl-coenzyme A synthetase/AMP-(fatty) acid ligase
MQATPATWNLLLESGWSDGKGLTILCGGEAMSRTMADRLLATGAAVWNMYGPTETTIWSALWRVAPGRPTPPVGYPIANTQLYVLGEDLSPVPIGVAGELFIGGLGLARGYHNRPELTNKNFMSNPFARLNSAGGETRMYKTGDRALRLSDGSVVVLGRSDFQIKIRGYRIELGEIESALLEHPAIRECVVVDRQDTSETRVLVAYVVFRDTMTAQVDILYASLRRKLPLYMLPSQFVFLKDLPRLPNGKINRAGLPEPLHDRPNLTVNFVAPQSDVERSLASIWGAVLGIKDFGVLDNFFDLGGHSMALASVHLKAQELFKHTIELVRLFEYPTIRAFAEYLRKEPDDAIKKSVIEDRAQRQKTAMAIARKRVPT